MSVDGTGWERRNEGFAAAMTDAQMAYVEAERRVSELEKLLVAAHKLLWHGCDCTECDFFEQCKDKSERYHVRGCLGVSILRDHMRELGIEVD